MGRSIKRKEKKKMAINYLSTDVDLAPYAKTADFVALSDTDLEAMWAEA